MQPIERYGVITLMLLVVTIFVVALWEDGEGSTDAKAAKAQVADVRDQRTPERKQERTQAPGGAAASQRGNRGANGNARPNTSARRGQNQADARRSPARAAADELLGSVAQNSPEPQSRAGAPVALPDLEPQGARPGRESAVQASLNLENLRPEAPSGAMFEVESGPEPVVRPGSASAARNRRGNNSRLESSPSTSEVVPPSSTTTLPAEARGRVAREVKVASGDSLSVIAQRELGTSRRWREIAELNGITDPTSIYVGQVLQLPAGEASAPSAGPSGRSNVATAGNGEHVVAAGDVLSVIAQERLGKASRWKEILALNPGIDPDRLVVGDRLKLPGGARAVPASSASGAPDGERVVSLTPSSALRKQSKVR